MTGTTFHSLYEAHARDIFRLARFLTGSETAAADVTSETFLRAWAGRDTIRAVSAKAYLLAIARNLSMDERRRARRLSDGDVPAVGVAPDAEVRMELADTRAAIERLPPQYREPLLLAASGIEYRGIAESLGISEATVKIRVYRARQRLEGLLGLKRRSTS